ncbi:uncharacterized protein LOC113873677 [Abrus precatorius]|uniref:Uncharacterized protein LOC113873677 n=1 Tax=Abrus precatorius TaxID=3816 RepID=A0A8B8MJE8_ABRPR|nr:uncharacterized protein LOC113873677 [Abrus precatorius]
MQPNQAVPMMEGDAICSTTNAPEEDVDLNQISLRPIDLSDLDDVMLWSTDDKVAKYCTWEPHTSKEDGINFIQNIASKSLWFRAICLHNRAIGCIDLLSSSGQRRCRDKSAELGYALGSRYWGKGIATQVVKQVVKAAFSYFPHLERLEALVDVENVGSQRVLEKAGFQREGILRKYVFVKGKSRDMVMFSFLSNGAQF